jgi:hypothetical protein
VPLKVPPCAAITVGLLQAPPGRVVVVVGGRVVVVVVAVVPGGVTVKVKVPCAPPKPSTKM